MVCVKNHWTTGSPEMIYSYLHVQLFAGRQVCKLWSVVIDVSDQDLNGGSGIETRVTLICNHHLQTVLPVLLPVQRHPVDNFTWVGAEKTEQNEDAQLHSEAQDDLKMALLLGMFLPVLALMRKNFPSESRM